MYINEMMVNMYHLFYNTFHIVKFKNKNKKKS